MRLRREIYWLARHFKAAPVPLILHDAASDACGYYQWPTLDVMRLGRREYQPRDGAVVLGTAQNSGTIAHEYRHHLQFWRLGRAWRSKVYAECPLERDAFSFELALCGERDGVIAGWSERLRLPRRGRSDALNSTLPSGALPGAELDPVGRVVYGGPFSPARYVHLSYGVELVGHHLASPPAVPCLDKRLV